MKYPAIQYNIHELLSIYLSFLKDLEFGIEQGVDMVFASFTRKAQDVHDVRAQLGEKGKNIRIISKV